MNRNEQNAKRQILYESVGVRIRELREKSGVSQSAIALAIGVNKATISAAESGEACSLHLLVLIAEYFDDCTLDDLVPIGGS